MNHKYFPGLDLGQAQDYTALAILERHGAYPEFVFHARHLQRFPLGTPFPTIVTEVGRVLARLPPNYFHVFYSSRRHYDEPGHRLAIDQTGLGAPIVDLFREAQKRGELRAALWPIHISPGATESYEKGVHYVPKRNLVSTAQIAVQTGRLKIAPELPEARTLTQELLNFKVKITDAGNDTYGAWREGQHDDLVLAVAMALWVGNRRDPEPPVIRSYSGLRTY